jgi:hypothetical protein
VRAGAPEERLGPFIPASSLDAGTCEKFDFFKMHRKRAEIYSTEPRRDVDMRRYFEDGTRMVCEGEDLGKGGGGGLLGGGHTGALRPCIFPSPRSHSHRARNDTQAS